MAKLKSGTRVYGNATIDSLLTVGTVNNITITSPATSATLTLAQGSTLVTSGAFSTTLTATGTTNVTLPTSGTLATTAGTLSSATNSTQSGYFGDIFLYDDSTPSHYLGITNSANLTAARTLSINVNDADRTISLSGNLTVSSAATISGTNTGDQTITLTGDVTGSGTGSFAATIASDAVTFAKMQNSAAAGLSVIGRSTNSAGDFAEIAAGTDGHVLYRASSTSLTFGQLPTAGIANSAVTYAKIQNVSATDKLLGRSAAGAGSIEEITCTAAGRALLDDADAATQRTTLGLGTIATQASSSVSITGGTITGITGLGVGVATAQSLVHLRSDANSAVTHLYLMNRTSGADVGSRIAFTTSANDLSDNRHAYIGAVTTGATQNGNHFVIATNPNGATAEERLRVTSTGGVGIGTINPDSRLHVAGGDLHVNSLDGTDVDIKLGVTASFNNFSIIRSTRASDSQSLLSFYLSNSGLKEMIRLDLNEVIIRGSGDGTTAGDAGVILFSDQSETALARITSYKTGTNNNTDLIFSTKGSGLGVGERMRIASTGALGFDGENYGDSGQVLTSNGPNSPPSWQSGGGGVDAIEVMLFG